MIKNTSLILICTAVLALLGEFAASFFVVRRFDYIKPHHQLNHVWHPSTSFVHREFVYKDERYPDPYTHIYNKQGWVRGDDIEHGKPQDTVRIFYVGDSFIEGTAPMEQSVPALLERWLNSGARELPFQFEVINTGTTSYSTLLYYILIRYYAALYNPDVIVLNVDMTDVYDDTVYARTLIRDSDGDPFAVPPRDIYSAAYLEGEHGTVPLTRYARALLFLQRNSYLYNLALQVRSTLSTRRRFRATQYAPGGDERRWDWMRRERNEMVEVELAHTLDTIGRIARFCRASNIKLVMTGVPHRQQFERDVDSRWSAQPHTDLKEYAAQEGILYFDSYSMLEDAMHRSSTDRFYYRNDMHFNPAGYHLWACAHWQALGDLCNVLLPEGACELFDRAEVPCERFIN